MLKKLSILMILAVLVTACVPAAQPADVQEQVNTAVAATMQANERIDLAVEQTASAQEAQATDAPAEVEVVLQATATTAPTNTPFVAPTLAVTATRIPPKYACAVYTRQPSSAVVMPRGSNFDIKWIVTNTGTNPLYDAADIKYYGGTQFADVNRAEIRKLLQPGESYEVVIDATAPNKSGTFSMIWLVEGPMCYAYVTIQVK